MSLDCLTPKGREWIARQHEAIELYRRRFPHFDIAHFDDESAAELDFVVIDDGNVKAFGEVRSREMTSEALFNQFRGEWIVTEEKLLRGMDIARRLRTRFFMLLYMVPEKRIFVEPIVDEHGFIHGKWRVDRTATQATSNGGTAVRDNAFLQINSKGWADE